MQFLRLATGRSPWTAGAEMATPSTERCLGTPDRLGEHLLARGVISVRTLRHAKRIAAETGQRLDRVLSQLELVPEEDLAELLALLLGLPLIVPVQYPPAPLLPNRLKGHFLRKSQVLPIDADETWLLLAMADPLDRFTRSIVEALTGRTIGVAVATPRMLGAAIERLYPGDRTERP